jgi:hypothetical protein
MKAELISLCKLLIRNRKWLTIPAGFQNGKVWCPKQEQQITARCWSVFPLKIYCYDYFELKALEKQQIRKASLIAHSLP